MFFDCALARIKSLSSREGRDEAGEIQTGFYLAEVDKFVTLI